MATEFDDSEHWGLFMTGLKLTSETGKAVRMSELVLAALRAAGIFDNLVDGTSPPATDKLWLDKNTDPAVLKQWDATGSSWVPMTYGRLFGLAALGTLAVTGGTANAIVVAQPNSTFQANRLYTLTPTANNAAGAVTIQVSGVGTYPVKYGNGANLLAAEFTNGRQAILFFDGTKFIVVFSVGDLNAAVTAAQQAATDASGYASAASTSAGNAATSASNAASAATGVITGATADDTVDDTDEVIYKTGTTIKRATFAAGIIASIFKTTRTIANVVVQASTFRMKNSGGFSPLFDATGLTADRGVSIPDRPTKLGAAATAILAYQVAQNTSGGAAVATTWTTRPLNTELFDPENIVSISSNQFTPTVDCLCQVDAGFYATTGTAIRIYNVTDSAIVADSVNMYNPAANSNMGSARVAARLTGGKTYRVEYYTSIAQSPNGLGIALNISGRPETHMLVILEAA